MDSPAVPGPHARARLAGRLAALGVDTGVIAAWAGAAAGVGWLVRRQQRSLSPAQADAVALGTLIAPTLATFAVMEASPRQATPGKRLVGLQVQSVDGHRLTLTHALARNAAKLAPWQLAHTAVFRMVAGSPRRRWPVVASAAQLMVLASAVTMLRDPDDRSWHDLLTRTRVVRVPCHTDTRSPAGRP